MYIFFIIHISLGARLSRFWFVLVHLNSLYIAPILELYSIGPAPQTALFKFAPGEFVASTIATATPSAPARLQLPRYLIQYAS